MVPPPLPGDDAPVDNEPTGPVAAKHRLVANMNAHEMLIASHHVAGRSNPNARPMTRAIIGKETVTPKGAQSESGKVVSDLFRLTPAEAELDELRIERTWRSAHRLPVERGCVRHKL